MLPNQQNSVSPVCQTLSKLARRYPSLLLCTFILTLTACSSSKSISKAKDITDNGRDNIVLLSYDITADVYDRHASETSTGVTLNCKLPGDGTDRPICFKFNLPYTGQVTHEGGSLHRFTKNHVDVFRMRYGTYPLERFVYNVVYDVRREPYCYTNKKKKVVCNTRTERDKNYFKASLPEPVTFDVEPGDGCYLGHMKIRIIGNSVVEFDLDQELKPETFENLSEDVREVSKLHVTKACTQP